MLVSLRDFPQKYSSAMNHEDLLGYLLGALEPDEMQRVSQWLREHPEAREQLAEIERSLRPLEEGFEAIEAPSDDLLARTLDGIPEGPPPKPGEDAPSISSPVPLCDADPSAETGSGRVRWSWLDTVGSLLSVAVLLALLLPMIAAGRFEARKIACQDQLRELGTALMQYVSRDPQGRLPQVAKSGPEAFAGVYRLRLADQGLLTPSESRWCPSADMPDLSNQAASRAASVREQWYQLPAVKELAQLPVDELQRIQRIAGGHYAYSLGVVGDQGFSSPRFEARTSFAVMADAPVAYVIGGEQEPTLRFSHGGRGVNVLYEDGAVRFIRIEALDSMPDHPFVNHIGVGEAGVNVDDASLGPSWWPPFRISLQR
jgi:hypothetical protein